MGLRVYKSTSDKAYENDFFRIFASNLSELFKQKGFDGVLLGHPKHAGNDWLKPDAVLITKNSIIIIDLKNYDGSVKLPNRSNFENGTWFFDSGYNNGRVAGGASANPYQQLQKQKDRLSDVLSINNKSITTGVVFQKEVVINDKVPGKFEERFFVADALNYVDRIFNRINVHKKDINLSDDEMNKIVSMFDVEPYKDLPSIDPNKFKKDLEIATETRKTEEAKATRAKAWRNTIICLLAVIFVTIIGYGMFEVISRNISKTEQIAQLEEDRKSGKVCIPSSEAANYEGLDGVCVEYYVNYVNDSKHYVFVSDKKNGDFTALVKNKAIISLQDAKDNYLNRRIEVRGKIIKYEDTHEIEVYDASQIKVTGDR